MHNLQPTLMTALAGLNVLALLLVLLVGRERRREAAPARPDVAPDPEPQTVEPPGDDPFQALVQEADRVEASFAGRGRAEARLAQNIARWRDRAGGGRNLPPEDERRSASGRQQRGRGAA